VRRSADAAGWCLGLDAKTIASAFLSFPSPAAMGKRAGCARETEKIRQAGILFAVPERE